MAVVFRFLIAAVAALVAAALGLFIGLTLVGGLIDASRGAFLGGKETCVFPLLLVEYFLLKWTREAWRAFLHARSPISQAVGGAE